MSAGRAPAYWVRQQRGSIATQRLNEVEAAMIARRAGVRGDLYTVGIVWRERDKYAAGGWAYWTVAPVFDKAADVATQGDTCADE